MKFSIYLNRRVFVMNGLTIKDILFSNSLSYHYNFAKKISLTFHVKSKYTNVFQNDSNIDGSFTVAC